MDYAAEGLLQGADDEAAVDARKELLDELIEAGVQLDELKNAVAEDRLALLPTELILRGEGRYTIAEVAEASGLPQRFLLRQLMATGLPRPGDDDAVFGDDDVEAAKAVKIFRDAGLPDEAMLEVGRVIGHSMAAIADAARTIVGESFLLAGDSEHELGLRFARVARELNPVMGKLLESQFRVFMREGIKRDAVGSAELRSGHLPGSREVTVGFADLVGFTSLGEQLPADEIGSLARRLSALVGDVVKPPVRLVKMIGDAAMLVSTDDTASVLDTVLELVALADDSGNDLPQLRAGVAVGSALPRAGDWYGRPVNLASRITSRARAGSVLASEAARDAAGDGYRWSFAGNFELKGIEGRPALYRARPAEYGETEADT